MSTHDTAAPVLEIRGLCVSVPGAHGPVPLLAGVDLVVGSGESVGIVGESGSGKSLTCRAVLGLVPRRADVQGAITVAGTGVLGVPDADVRAVRRHRAAMVFQDPHASVNPVRRIGDHLVEALRADGVPRREARDRAVAALTDVGLRDPVGALRRYPHQFSGGMLQRITIAAAMLADPDLLIADEATTALDVTTQAEVVTVLQDNARARGAGLLFVTHDLDLAAAVCDRIVVMYAGRVVEVGTADDVLGRPQHPYTRALLAARPRLGQAGELRPVTGRPVALAESPGGCSFRDRCPSAAAECEQTVPRLVPTTAGQAACLRIDEREPA